MSELKNYYFDLFHRDVEPIVKANSIWSLQGAYVIEHEDFGYTNWVSDEHVLQTVVPNGEDVAMHILTDNTVMLDMDAVAHSVEIAEAATLNVTDDRSLLIGDSFILNGLVSVSNNGSLTNASAEAALRMTGVGTLNLSANGYVGSLGTQENRNAFAIGQDLTVTTFGWSPGYIYANLTNEGTITTQAGELTLKGNTIENAGRIITGGRNIYLEDATVNGGALNGANGEIQLYGVTVNNGALTGTVKVNGENASTLNQITVDENGELNIQAQTIAQGALGIEGKVHVWNNKSLINASGEAAVALTGTGTLNLSANGYVGSLGTQENRNAFAIGQDLTVTTFGWSPGYIYANLTNEGTITTQAGELTLKGNTIENAGRIITGGRKIYLEDATVNGGALNGANGEILLNGTAVNNGTLTGSLIATGEAVTLNRVTLDENGELNIQAQTIAQGALGIEGKVNVWNNKSLINASGEAAVALTGVGTLNLSANGYSGYLGTQENRNAFAIGQDLTVTTNGWSPGYIYADLTNNGTVTTQAGDLTLKGNTIENKGTIVTGGRSIFLEDATVNGGALNGANGDILLYGVTVNNGTLTGTVKVNGENASTLNRVTLDENGELNIQAQTIAQGALGIEGKVHVWNNKSLINASAEAAVALTGTGTLNLSANGYSGYLGTKETRNAFVIGKDLTITTNGWSTGYIYADLTNEGTITTEAGNLTLSGNTIENNGTIVTGGEKSISLDNTTVTGGALNGRSGTVYLNGSALTETLLKGQVRATDNKSTLKNATVDHDCKFTANIDIALQETFAINGTVSVQNNAHLLNESAEAAIKLTGIGTLNLSANGYSGYLGGNENGGGFELGEGLTVTTLGWSSGYIAADVKNNGVITTSQGSLNITDCSIENNGVILTGGKGISLSGVTVTGDGVLNGANGTITLANAILDGAMLNGVIQSQAGTVLNGVALAADGRIDAVGPSTTNGMKIDGFLSVTNNARLLSSGEEAVALIGAGTIGLSGNGTSGYLGDTNSRFTIGEGLTLTTPGWSTGNIAADVTNYGEIVTDQGELSIAGTDDDPLSFRNCGTVRAGSKAVRFTKMNMDNAGGSVVGENGAVYIGSGATLTGGTLGGTVHVSGEGAGIVLGQDDCIRGGRITVSDKGTFTASNTMAQGTIDVGSNGTLALSSVALAGTINACNNPQQVTLAGVNGAFELVLNAGYASRYTIIGNDFTNAVLTIQGGGSIDLSGNYWGGLTDEDAIRSAYDLGDNVNVSNPLAVAPEGKSLFLTDTDLENEKYLSLSQKNLKVYFLSALDPQSITEESVQLWDESTGEQVSMADRLPIVRDNELIFDNALFADGHTYRVVFSDKLRSLDGCTLNTAFRDTVAFMVDRTAPKVVNIEKTVNLTGKLPDFRITFSSDVDIATLRGALKVTSPDEQNIDVQIEMLTDRVALVTSKTAINVPGEYAVTIDAGKVTDKAGNHLQESFADVIEMTRIDLDIADLVSSKDIVVQGETFTVQWKTFNLEEADLYGKWTDGVYLSKDDIWDNSDTLLASVVHYNGLPQGTSVSGQAQVSLSGVIDGGYYLLVRPDIYNEKPTGASERNVKSIAVSVSTEALPDGTRTIRPGQSSTYKFTAGAGDSYQLTLDTLRDDYNGMELYVGYGYAPTRENYDTAVRGVNDAQLALTARNYDQDIYVMVYAKNGGSVDYTLTAEKAGLDILSVTPGIQSIQAGQALTFVVEGLCFTPDTTVVAVNADEQAVAGAVDYVNDHQLLLTFAPGTLGEGDYVLKATDGEATALSETVTLTSAGAPNLEVTADLPQRIGNHYITSFDVNYANTGDASMGAVLLTVNIYEVDQDGRKTRSVGIMGVNKSVDQNHTAYNGSYSALPTGYVSTAAIYAQGKVPGQLEAGASGSVTIDLVGLLKPWNTNGNNNLLWEINYFDENSAETLDWQEFMPGQSDAFYVAMESSVGNTWGDYVKMLQTNAQTLLSVGTDSSNAADLLQLTVQTVSGNLNPYVAIEDITDLNVATAGALQLRYERFYSNRIDDRGWHTNWEYSLVKEENDAVTFFSPETGVYTFRRDAYGNYFCENSTDVTLKFKGSQAVLQDVACERIWTLERVDEQNWRLAQVADTHGDSIQLHYDKDGNLSKLASSDGEYILVTKDGLTGSNGLEVAFLRSAAGRLTGVSYNDGRNPLSYQYDGDALTGVLQGGEPVSAYQYDDSGSVVQATHGNLVTTVTTEQAGVITVADNCDHSFTAVYYADGNLARLTDNVSGNWNYYTYDVNGQLQTVTASAGGGETYVFNANGDLLRYTDAYGNSSAYTYFQGHVKTIENATGFAVNISYDQDWNITEFTCSDGSVITIGYDDNGNMTRVTDPLGNAVLYAYDDARRISKVSNGGYSFALTYDNLGNIASVTKNGHTTSYGYNTLGQLTALTDANGNQARMAYDGNARLTEAVFADGSSMSWGYDAAGDWVSYTTRAGDVIANTWSADGLLTGTAVAGNQYKYVYNNEGRLTAAAGPDSVPNLAFEYNTRGDLTGVAYQDGTAIAIECDPTGKLASYTIGGQTFAYACEGGRMVSVSVNGKAFTAYTRNAEGYLTGGNGIAYEYDAANNITKVGDTEYTYNSASQIVRKSSAEGIWTYTYDLDGNLTGEMLGDGTAVNFAYTYDAAGNRLSKKDMVSGVTTTWTYGAMNQILTVRTGDAEAVEYAYDLNGNLLSDGRAAYTWTEDSRMATMTVDGTTWTYTYNALGYRDSASNGTDTFTFYYDAAGNLLAQYKNGAAYQFYVRGATGIEGYVDAEGAVYTFTYDLGGNVISVSGTNGKSATYAYDAFGNIIGQTGDITDNALTWHGHFGTLLNPDGSYYVLARNYSAADGRFISTDPSWFNDGANLYTYAYNDPVNFLDLNGMAGEQAGTPTKQEGNSFPEQLASGKWLENLFPGLKDKSAADLTTNMPKNTPKIGTGEAPMIFKTWQDGVGKATPKGSGFGAYYKNGFKLAEDIYKKGTIDTPEGTIWPPTLDYNAVFDDKTRDIFDRFQNTTNREEKVKLIQDAWQRKYELDDKEKSNESKPKGGNNATTDNSQSASSYDPNDKLATEGAAELHFVPDGSRLEYTVLFENDPDHATAPARKVYVRDVMDDDLDLDTFLLHSFTLAGYTYQLPEGRDTFNENVVLDLGDAEITVAVAINLDHETRELVASFTAIDPETGFELQDLTKGVLLVNDESGRGEGNLNYSIRALSGLPTDTQILNTAEIFFDFNDPIETPTTLNTIDASAPDAPSGLKVKVSGNRVTMSWTASADAGSGVKEYVVKYSHDGQEFTATTVDTSFVIENADDATWQWCVQAVDAVGNVSSVTDGEVFPVPQPIVVEAAKSDIDGNGISDVMFVWTGNNYQHGYWMNGTSEWQSAGSSHPAEWENLGCYDMTGDGKADSVLVGNVVVSDVKGAYIGYYADAIDNPDGSTWVNIGYLTNADDIAWKNKVGNLTGNESGANSIVWYAPELYALGAWTDGTNSWITLSNSFGGEDWTLVGCGDFDGDGRDSVVMSGAGGTYFYAVGIDGLPVSMGSANWSGWEVRAIGDFAGDGRDDMVLFHKEYGSMVMLADGSLDDYTSIGQLDAQDWFVVGAGDYDNDRKDDLLVRQYTTGMLGYYKSGDTSQWIELGRGVDMNWTVIA